MSETPSIYEYICAHVVDGALPADFNLDTFDNGTGGTNMADGALDGISIYHRGRTELPGDVRPAMEKAVDTACAGDFAAADELLASYAQKYRAISLIDELQNSVLERVDNIDADALEAYVKHLLFETTDKELAKFGLILQEAFVEPEDDVKEVVRTFGLSDEFTVFALWNMLRWSNANDEVFALAKKVHGWGRVHAVERLEPANEDIRAWLVADGLDNDVHPSYTALACFINGDVADRLETDIDHDEFANITKIIYALVDEGPTSGIASLGNPDGVLKLYCEQAAKQHLDAEDCNCIQLIRDYAESKYWDEIVGLCDDLLPAE